MKILNKWALDFLNEKFREKKNKNPAFSLRAFAKHLKVSPTSLSEAMRGNRAFSEKTLKKISEKLSLTPAETALLLRNSKAPRLESLQKRDWKNFSLDLSLSSQQLREVQVLLHSFLLDLESVVDGEETVAATFKYQLSVVLETVEDNPVSTSVEPQT